MLIHKGTITLETEHLILRPLTLDDFDAVHSWVSNPENTRLMLWGPNNEEETKSFLSKTTPGKDFAVVLKEAFTDARESQMRADELYG